MTRASDSSTAIEGELLAEVEQELSRRTAAVKRRKPAPAPDEDLPASLCALAILATLAVLAGTGVMMALLYAPAADDAHASTAWIDATQPGALTRALHFHAANFVILLSAAYVGYLLWRGLYRARSRWWRAAAMLALVLAAGFTGQLLPYDQNALHGTLIRIGYIESVPLVGPMLAGLLSGGGDLGTSALTRFFGLHVIVLPALMAMLSRWLLRDARHSLWPAAQIGVPVAVVGLLLLVSLAFSAPLGLAGTLSEPFPDARPEWYALPLYELIKILPGDLLQLLALVLPPMAAVAAVIALPLLDRAATPRLLLPVRVTLVASLVAVVALSAAALYEDSADGAGWFRAHTVENLMAPMGVRNEALGNSADALAPGAHNSARDLQWLHERLIGVYPADMPEGDREQWDKWARQGAAISQELLRAGGDAEARDARARLREVCASCHEAHEKEDILLDPPRSAIAKAAPPAREYFFNQERVNALPAPDLSELSSEKLMDRGRHRLRDILAHAGMVQGEPAREREDALVELREMAAEILRRYDRHNGSFEEEDWTRTGNALIKAIDGLQAAAGAMDIARQAPQIGKACESCHEAGFDLDKPIEWSYSSLLQ